MPKFSIITASRNSAGTIKDAIASVLSQTWPDIEYIIVDGASADGTLEIIKPFANRIARLVSEPDRGIYDALNKGIKLATGEIIGILHSDDMFAHPRVLEQVGETMEEGVDSCYGDLVYVDRRDINKIIRYWRPGEYERKSFKGGWMPPHPAFFVRKRIHDQYGLYDLRFPIGADYELMLRFLHRHGITTAYIPNVLVRMRTGGTSSPGIVATARAVRENYLAWKANGLSISPLTFVLKPLSKLTQYFDAFFR